MGASMHLIVRQLSKLDINQRKWSKLIEYFSTHERYPERLIVSSQFFSPLGRIVGQWSAWNLINYSFRYNAHNTSLYVLQHDIGISCSSTESCSDILHTPRVKSTGSFVSTQRKRWRDVDKTLYLVCKDTPEKLIKCAYPMATMINRATVMMTQYKSPMTIGVEILSCFVTIGALVLPLPISGTVVLVSWDASGVGSAAIFILGWCSFLNKRIGM